MHWHRKLSSFLRGYDSGVMSPQWRWCQGSGVSILVAHMGILHPESCAAHEGPGEKREAMERGVHTRRTRPRSRPVFPSTSSHMPAETQAASKDGLAKKFGVRDDHVLSKLALLMSLYNLSPDDTFIQWESFVVTQENGDLDLSPAGVDKFQAYLQAAIVNSTDKRTPAFKKARDISVKRRPMVDFSSSPGASHPSTPQLKRKRPTLSSEPNSSPSKSTGASGSQAPLLSSPKTGPASAGPIAIGRSNPAEPNPTESENPNTVASINPNIVESLNPHLLFESFADNVQLSANFDVSKFKFRTMAMKLLESADVLDEQIDSVSMHILEAYKSSGLLLSNPCMSSQFDVICCGRIVPDSPLYDALKLQVLNDKSLFLETSRLGGIGQRIPLDVSCLAEYSFFPGQIVALKGRNPTGRTFVVSEVIDLPMLGAPVSALAEIKAYQSTPGSTKVLVAAGPFSNLQGLNYNKLRSLVELVNTSIKPQVVLLLGPFLDLSNKAVQLGAVEMQGVSANQQPRNLDELFKCLVAPILKEIDSAIQVILIPSQSDVINKHASYPQTPLDRKKLGLPKNFKCFPNPSGFSINEVMFGTSNIDVFKDLKDVHKLHNSGEGKVSSNRFDRIANHIFQQRRYYPVFPGSVKFANTPALNKKQMSNLREGLMADELAETDIGGACLEVPYSGLAEMSDSLPDIVIIPSEMKFFAKVVRGVVVVNPGQFIRPAKDASREDGSYAVLSVKPADPDIPENVAKVDNSDYFYHNIYKRCRVDIWKS